MSGGQATEGAYIFNFKIFDRDRGSYRLKVEADDEQEAHEKLKNALGVMNLQYVVYTKLLEVVKK